MAAADALAGHIHRTPIFRSSYLDDYFGAEIYFKAENLQKTGSFKARGAMNSILKLPNAARRNGVATHSSGNHAQALAWAAGKMNLPCVVVMPDNSPRVKINAVQSYGANIRFCEANLNAREQGLEEVMTETGAHFIPPYNYLPTIEGQSTCGVEIFREVENPDMVLTPVGGGGLLSGTALSGHWFSPQSEVIGCEPLEANDAWQSLIAGRLIPLVHTNTIADGLRTSLGDITFPIIKNLVSDIVVCQEASILKAMRIIWERLKLVVEPSAAVPLACMLEIPERFASKKLVIILSGGNVDLDNLPFKKL